jgi:hypothetical protein
VFCKRIPTCWRDCLGPVQCHASFHVARCRRYCRVNSRVAVQQPALSSPWPSPKRQTQRSASPQSLPPTHRRRTPAGATPAAAPPQCFLAVK